MSARFGETAISVGGGSEANIETESKKIRASGDNQVCFDVAEDQTRPEDEENLSKKRRRDFLECHRRVTNVLQGRQPNGLSCEIGGARRRSDASKEKSLEKREERGVCRARSRMSETLGDERKSGYPCRICQPEVTPTRCSSAARLRQGNFWRCTRHQPGASYRLEASRLCGRREVLENEVSLGETGLKAQTIRALRPVEDEKSVAGMMRRLLRGRREKSEVRNDEASWNAKDDERNGDMNFVCCRCSCPYLVTAPPRGNGRHHWESGAGTGQCKKCVCCQCFDRRERRTSSRRCANCPKHCRGVKNQSGAKKRKKDAPEKKLRVCEEAQVEKSRVDAPEKNNEVSNDRAFEKKSSDDGLERSETRSAGRSEKPEKVDPYGIQEFFRSSTDSGACADVSDSSKRMNASARVASVTSSTFIRLIKEKPVQPRVVRNLEGVRDSRDETETLVVAPRRGGRRGKRRFARVDRATNGEACRCLDTAGNSEFRRYEESILEAKHVTYGSAEESLGVEGTFSSPHETFGIRGNVDSPEKSSNAEVPKRIDGERHLAESFLRAERASSEDLSKIARRAEARSFGDVRLRRGNKFAKRNDLETGSDKKNKDGGASRERTSSTELPTGEWLNSESVKVPTVTATEGNPTAADRSQSRDEASRGTDMAGVKLEPGPCLQKPIAFDKFQEHQKISSSSRSIREFLGSSYEAVESYFSDTADFRNPNDGDNLKSADSSKKFMMVEPFVRDTSEADADTIDTDDPEIEDLDLEENIASTRNADRARKASIPKTAFFSSNEKKDGDKCYAKYCAERKFGIARSNDELILQSCSETQE